MTESLIRNRQRPLVQLYREEPSAAWVTDRAVTRWNNDDPFHSEVYAGHEHGASMPVSLHVAVGGDSDAPVAGDILCAALASCLDSTVRAIAARVGLPITHLEIEATSEVDVRGTLCVDRSVPVAFQRMSVRARIRLAAGAPSSALEPFFAAVEHSCVVLQTLRLGLPVEFSFVDEAQENDQDAATAICA